MNNKLSLINKIQISMKVEKLKRIVVNQNSGVGKIVVVIGGVICVVAFVACKKQCDLKPKEGFKIVGDDKNCYYEAVGDCSGLYVLYTNAQTDAAADSMKVVNYFANWMTDAPAKIKGLVSYYMIEEGMTEEQAWDAALCLVRDNPNNPSYTDEVKNYVKTYFGLVDQFEQSKKNRMQTYTDWQNCENSGI